MTVLNLICAGCKNEFIRDLRHVNENKKLKRKNYCSIKCLGISQKHRIKLTCENPSCHKQFERTKSDISPHNYCSYSCSARVSNAKRGKTIRICKNPTCRKEFFGDNVYCSVNCIPQKESQYTKNSILEIICEFTKTNGRIPTKNDLLKIYVMARRHFGTWNNAIKAGFNPNPVRFSKKHIANDGHKCDSLSEKIIDDWLYARKILHERNVPYNKNNMTADFKVDKILIEFLGLAGQLKSYDQLVSKKRKIWKEKGLKVIEIYPYDLFPENKLSKILKLN